MPRIDKRDWPLVIVGSGPAGIGVALEAKRRGVDALMIDRGSLCNTIYNFPERMTFFSTAELLEFPGIPMFAEGAKPSRREVLDYFTRIVTSNDLPVQTYCEVKSIASKDGRFIIGTTAGDFAAGAVVLATGSYDQPNKLSIPGEDFPHVSHYYKSPHPYVGQEVVIVGGKNSAAEAALELHRASARVTLVHRKDSVSPSVKYWIKPDLDNRIREGSIRALFNSRVTEITANAVKIESESGVLEVPADAVLLLTGYNPNFSWLRSLGLKFEGKAELPVHNAETLETNVQGLYVAGVVIAGRETSRVFIENSRTHGAKIVEHFFESDMSERWFRVCKLESLKNGTAQSITILGKPYAVFNVADKLYGLDASCRHMRANLAAGKISGAVVTCFMHDWRYDICTGKCLTREGYDTTPRDVKIENNEVWISVSWPDEI